MDGIRWPGVCLALDWGKARIGVAACDADGILAYPVETVQTQPRGFYRVKELIAQKSPALIFVGLPLSLRGKNEISAQYVRSQARRLAKQVSIPVRLVDERLTTVTASKQLHEAGRNTRQQRAVIDQAAAVAILNQVLDSYRVTGIVPGDVISNSAQNSVPKQPAIGEKADIEE